MGIIYRGDSHYGGPEVYQYCTEHDMKFVTGLSANERLLKLSASVMSTAKELFTIKKTPITLFDEFSYQAASWSCPYRVIVKAEYNEKGPNTRFIVTNITGSTPRFIYQTIYSGRGKMEQFIKDHKNHLACDQTSCPRFEANQMRLFFHSAAYILLHAFRSIYLRAIEFAHSQFDTIRLTILRVGARVRELVTCVKFHLPSSFP